MTNPSVSDMFFLATESTLSLTNSEISMATPCYYTSEPIEPIAKEGGVQAGTTPPTDKPTTNAYNMIAMLYVGQD